MGSNQDKAKALELRVKELEEENNLLTGRIEEMMLLNLITKSFDSINDEGELLSSVLEKISILKNIPFCGCFELNGSINCIGNYCAFLNEKDCKSVVDVSKALLKTYESESVVLESISKHPAVIKLQETKCELNPSDVLIIPFQNRKFKNGAFVFISDDANYPFSQDLLPFNQLIQTILDKWDKITIVNELHQLNQTLEQRVKDRTIQLSESEEKYRQLFNLANDAIFLWELNSDEVITCCLQLNEAAMKLSGFTTDELKLINPFDLLGKKHSQKEKQRLEKSFRLPSAVFHASFTSKDNNEIPLEIHTRRFQWNKKDVVVAIARDFTERKAFEKELIKARNKAVESERLKSAFLANMSHEIRTPMNAIVGFSELLSQEGMDAHETKMYSEIIFKNSLHLLNLIDDIVDYSKIEANRVNIVDNCVNINQVISDLSINMISILHNANKSHIDVITYTPLIEGDANIRVDGTRLRQILSNLINNAIKFTSDGHIEVGYSLLNKTTLEFFVRDSGKGIAIEDQQKVFERFVQVKEENAVHPGGTGLGLTICSNLVEKMKGKMRIESELNNGTTFFFTLPYNLCK